MGAIRLRIREGAAAAPAEGARSSRRPSRHWTILSSPLQRDDLAALVRDGGAERRPLLHQPTTLLEQVAAPIGGLVLALDRVRRRWQVQVLWAVTAR